MFELYYDNGSGPVLWEMEYHTMYFEDCTDDEGYWECYDEYGYYGHF